MNSIVGRSSEPNPVDKLMKRVSILEKNLELLESEAPIFWGTVQQVVSPHLQRVLEYCRQLILLAGELQMRPKVSRGQQRSIRNFAFFLVEHCKEVYGEDLSSTLVQAGFDGEETEADSVDDEDKEEIELELEYYSVLISCSDVKPPNEIWQSFQKAYRNKERPDPSIGLWIEENLGNVFPGKEKAGRKKKKSVDDALDPEVLQKKLYHGLARDLHPDKTVDEEERKLRTELMQRLNAAYRDGDINALLRLLQVHGSDRLKSGVDADAVQQIMVALEDQCKGLEEKLRAKLSALPDIGKDWLWFLRDPEKQERFLRKEKSNANMMEAQMKHMWSELSRPNALWDFLKRTNELDWENMF